jgi:hypothetical protein
MPGKGIKKSRELDKKQEIDIELNYGQEGKENFFYSQEDNHEVEDIKNA